MQRRIRLKRKLRGQSWANAKQTELYFCANVFCKYFALGALDRVDLVLSSVEPTDDDDYYVVNRLYNSRCWALSPASTLCSIRSPWAYTWDRYLDVYFFRKGIRTVYAWLEEVD